MTQTYQEIGSESPELHNSTSQRKGWNDDPPAIPQIDQVESHNTSFWNDRANLQDIGATGDDGNYAADFYGDGDSDGIPSWPAMQLQPTAATHPKPFTGYSEDGIITADQVSPSLPPGSPTVASQPASNEAGSPPYP
jgi:hypothetical protein